LFTAGQLVEMRNAERGGRSLPAMSLSVTSTTTVADLNEFLSLAMGINTDAPANPGGAVPGAALDPATGIITVNGNAGSINNLGIDASDLRILDSAGNLVRQPFVTDRIAEADGEGIRTAFIAYDSLGNTMEVKLGLTMESRSSLGTTWRYFVESDDNMGASTQMGTGTLSFDTEGNLLTTTPIEVSIDRTGTGANSPQSITLRFSEGADKVTSLSDSVSSVQTSFRDGAPIGTLTSFLINADGVISGSFDNGLVRTLGQVAIATFTNNGGLVDNGNNLFTVGANSGSPVVTTARTLGAGQFAGSSLELSNVDIGEEFIKMILSSTGYSASSRVIRTADELMQQLMVLGR